MADRIPVMMRLTSKIVAVKMSSHNFDGANHHEFVIPFFLRK
jgi:hypothetical protein